MKPSLEVPLLRLRQSVAETLICVQCDSSPERRRELGGWLDEFTPSLSADRARAIALLLRDRATSWSQARKPGSLPRVAKKLQDAADAFLISISGVTSGGAKRSRTSARGDA